MMEINLPIFTTFHVKITVVQKEKKRETLVNGWSHTQFLPSLPLLDRGKSGYEISEWPKKLMLSFVTVDWWLSANSLTVERIWANSKFCRKIALFRRRISRNLGKRNCKCIISVWRRNEEIPKQCKFCSNL